MQYQRSHDIEQRLLKVLALIETGDYSTPGLAEAVNVSIPTISRDVTALRQRGHQIKAEKRSTGWHYMLEKQKRRRATSSPDQLAEVQG